MSVLSLARPEIRALTPYASARMEAQGGRVLLNANETTISLLDEQTPPCHRYPDPQPSALLQALADCYGVMPDQVLAGRGSDEAIDLLLRAFCRAGQDAILIQPPTFGMYAVCARIQNAQVIEVALDREFTVDVTAVLDALTPAVKLVFVCAPNNPSGQAVSRERIVQLLDALAGRALLVVDEAYIEFADTGSVAELIHDYEHLVVLRTLSKAWALAGARIGCLLARAEVVALLRRIMAPYPLPVPCIALALEALSASGRAAMRRQCAALRRERGRMRECLAGLPEVIAVLPSQANFLAVRFRDAGEAFETLATAGIIVRDIRKYPGLGDALRITLGTPEENDAVLATLAGDRR